MPSVFSCLVLAILTQNSIVDSKHAGSFQPPRIVNLEQVKIANETPKQPLAQQHYSCYGGELSNYPSVDEWLSWDALWNVNREQVLSSNGGDTYIQHYVQEAILQAERESNVDARLILAILMQESNGKASVDCVRSKCGIMHASKGSSFDKEKPRESILQMVRDGVVGRPRSGPSLATLLSGKPRIKNLAAGCPYGAARAYNSGFVKESLDDAGPNGQESYVNDVANRLIGWNGRGKGYEDCR